MRILHVTPWLAPRYGGPAVMVPQLSAALEARGHHAEIVTTNVDGNGVLDVPTGRLVDWAGSAVTFHPVQLPRRFLTSWQLLRDVRRRIAEFDIVHVHYLYRFHGLAAAIAARAAGVPYVVQAHGALDPWTRSRKRRAKDLYHFLVEDRIMRGASAVVCTSLQEERGIRELGYATPTFVAPCGVDTDRLRVPNRGDSLGIPGLDDDAQVVTYLGRITRTKGVDLLVDAFVLTAASRPDAHLAIAGPDDEGLRRVLDDVIVRAGLGDRVSFLGSVDEARKRALLQRTAVLVLPSTGESFGMAAAEAMAVGCPVVVTPRVAVQDIIREAQAGLVVERTREAIAGAVEHLLSERGVAERMGMAGRIAVDEQFAWPIVASEIERLYRAVLGSVGGSQNAGVAA